MADNPPEFDAIVIGAGMGGIYALHKLRNELGLRVRAFDRAGGIGGTWWWNRYPGAKSDSEGLVYRFSFDKETLGEPIGNNRYIDQADMQAYLESVVDKFDLRKDIQLDTGIDGMSFDEATAVWTVSTAEGETLTARYVVSALGPLSMEYYPDIKGRDSFQGRMVHTATWPADLRIDGKRVGIVGTGSTGTQFICAASKTAGHLTVFQRTAQYCVPNGNRPISAEERAEYRANHQKIWDGVWISYVGAGFQESQVPAMSVSAEERRRIFQKAWDKGNAFRFMLETFSDIARDPAANEAAAEFIRSKVREIVKDPETARKLMPTGYYARRPISNEDYYESFNRDNVALVSLKENPIREITPNGVVTEDGAEHDLDVLVFATGFDAFDGTYKKMEIRGRGGVALRDHWKDGAGSYLGIACNRFPNMFMVFGPGTVFSNLPPGIETQVDWITSLIKTAIDGDKPCIEATEDAERTWTSTCDEIAEHSLFSKVDSFINGGNIPGKKKRLLFYVAGLAAYRQKLGEVAGAGYDGFVLGAPMQREEQPTA
ncbi:NAD(P)/FAD-dependent oxidoreductase [Actinomadura sp. 7K507]|uniref:flavin-containing monooxygenase n=1 Tax=Actinomadura sp. 7K507 TaxID=2530365 RepID=UPI001044A4FB|nr:NAD(P)/FAD-dependent oxidoreductase [Actinomadura sp. 7K507]TDC98390.1 NAD(P)/FAD-dependent oxidoreductase [Actinomadura sp. 7K507]